MSNLDRRTVLAAGAAAAVALPTLSACGTREPARKGPATIKKSDVPVGRGIVLSDANFVVTQPREGEYHAFVKICRHAGCAVSQVSEQHILCPCHGSQFRLTDGTVIQGPAQQGLSPATITDKGDSLEISA